MSGKRAIFEEVGAGEATDRAVRASGAIDRTANDSRGLIRIWMIALFALALATVLAGGLTRLTDSGLSITDWRPLAGAAPPMSEADWQAAFEKYKAIPEYRLQNRGMTLVEFKFIYWWEWWHRQLGRAVGLVWAIGFLGFLAAGRIPAGWTGRLLALGALGGLQGAAGWWMVASGLSGEMLDVASYRLAIHLGLAFAILGLIAWYAMQLARSERELLQARRAREPRLTALADILACLAFIQILLGALVAGIDAGRNYTDWPLMAGSFLPPDPLHLEPVWRNFFENDGLVQFSHRMAGYLLLLAGILVWRRSRRSGNVGILRAFDSMGAALLVQILLGIATVTLSSPWQLAILHQLGAVLLWALILRARHRSAYPAAESIRGA